MSKAVSALGGVTYDGYVQVAEGGPQGMITLRADAAGMAAGLAALGLPVPAQRRIETAAGVGADRAVAWMSPDEVLILLPYAGVAQAVAAVETALAGRHHLVADVSDARTLLRVRGAAAREVVAKACPVDLSPAVFGPGEMRRTRAAQVAAAIWLSAEDEISVICFRSVGRYAFDLFATLARPGAEVGLFR